MPMWSLDSTSMSGCLHSVGIATHLVTVPFILFFFSKPHLRLDTSRNRKYNQHILLQFVFVHVDWSCPSADDPEVSPGLIHGSGGHLHSMKSQGFLWICNSWVWDGEFDLKWASAQLQQQLVSKLCKTQGLNKVPAACLSLNKPKGYFGLRTNSLLWGLIFFKVLLQPNQSSPLCAHLQVSCWATVSIMQY